MRRVLLGIVAVATVAATASFLWFGRDVQQLSTPIAAHELPAPAAIDQAATQGATAKPTTATASATTSAVDPRVRPKHVLDFPMATFKAWKELAKRAEEGDVEAAKALASMVVTCRAVPESPDVIAGMIEREKMDAPNDPNAGAFIKQRAAECGLMTHQQRVSYEHWLSLAAKSGDQEAKLDYIKAAGPPREKQDADYWHRWEAYRKQASQYLDEELAAGNTKALALASSEYAGGEDSIYSSDITKQYAYSYAYMLATGNTKEFAFTLLGRMEKKMTPGQLRVAMAEGEQIYQSCCVRN